MPELPQTFRALILDEQHGRVAPEIRTLPVSALPAGDVLVQVVYSGLNYKDGLAILNRNKVVRSFPMVPGIDFAGTAATRRTAQAEYLRALGAQEIIDSAALVAPSGPLGSARWYGAIDTVGGDALAGVLRMLQHGASVAACGNAGGMEVHTTVLPF